MNYGLLGYKALIFNQGDVYSMSHAARWNYKALTARCYKSGSDWPYTVYCCCVPEPKCSCGIYATAPHPDCALAYLKSRNSILTVVRAHSKTVRHKLGWRAGEAEIIAVIPPESYWMYGLWQPDLYHFNPSVHSAKQAAKQLGVPLMDMVTTQALVTSSWDYYTGRLQ